MDVGGAASNGNCSDEWLKSLFVDCAIEAMQVYKTSNGIDKKTFIVPRERESLLLTN